MRSKKQWRQEVDRKMVRWVTWKTANEFSQGGAVESVWMGEVEVLDGRRVSGGMQGSEGSLEMSGIDIKVNAESWVYGDRDHFRNLAGWGRVPSVDAGKPLDCWSDVQRFPVQPDSIN